MEKIAVDSTVYKYSVVVSAFKESTRLLFRSNFSTYSMVEKNINKLKPKIRVSMFRIKFLTFTTVGGLADNKNSGPATLVTDISQDAYSHECK